MATWKKFFKSTNTVLPKTTSSSIGLSTSSKYSTWLPEVYLGPPNRLQRYIQYEQMDMDHEVHWALNIIAQFSVQPDEYSGDLFKFNFHGDPTPTETKILKKMLGQWSKLNDFEGRLFSIFRGTLMYGDQFFIRDPETYKLYWIDPHTVEKIVVNESKGKKIETYYIKDLSLNFAELVGTNQTERTQIGYGNTTSVYPQAQLSSFNNKSTGYVSTGYGSGSSVSLEENVAPVNAAHVVHSSLSRGMDSGWPFGISELEKIFKVYKQKELLEDAILIYRIHRAPERRIFFIDVGDMPPNKARTYLEQVKYEVQQKRMPTRGGGGESVQDSAYNPISTLEDYFFAVTESGRGSKVETLPGGENLGTIDDLKYFNNKMLRALSVPSSYLPSGPDDGTASVNDGKVGTAFIQEFTFSETCKRHQRQIAKTFDREFKMYLKKSGISIDSSLFTLEFNEPQNFAKYRQVELDASRLGVYASVAEIPYISKRFAIKRYLGLSEAEIEENERLWREESGLNTEGEPTSDMRNVGISSGDISGMGIPDDMADQMPDEGEMEMPEGGEEVEGAEAGI